MQIFDFPFATPIRKALVCAGCQLCCKSLWVGECLCVHIKAEASKRYLSGLIVTD